MVRRRATSAHRRHAKHAAVKAAHKARKTQARAKRPSGYARRH